MNKQDILRADLLDILFEHRNKSYGAYTLRRDYNNRLLLALGIAVSVVILIYFISLLTDNAGGRGLSGLSVNTVTVCPIITPDKPVLPPKAQKLTPVARVKNTTIRIVADVLADKTIPDQQLIEKRATADVTTDGIAPADPAIAVANASATGTGDKPLTKEPENKFVPDETPPSFPGGPEALAAFFGKTLSAPDELEAGERKVVYVRFIVGADGTIKKTEIVQSGGDLFDQEVLRCFKRMPRWNPASQNGMKIAVSFTQPVTFVSMDQ